MAQTQRARLLSRRRLLIAGFVGVPVIAGAVMLGRRWATLGESRAPSLERDGIRRRETRPTLEASRFTGKAALAYQAAREIPDILDQLHCYCGCDKTVGHVSLLSCYTDRHAVT